MDTGAKLKTDIQVRPSRSQVVLVSLIVLAGICYLSGFLFLWEDKQYSWVPIILGVVLSAVVVAAWFKAQKDTDLENSSPTIVRDNIGNQIATDTRALMSPEGIQNMERLFSALTHREPLPEPDGIIDEFGDPVPNTLQEAQKRVIEANLQAQNIADIASSEFGLGQITSSGVQPLLDEPYSEEIIDTNVGKT
ncbi:MAG: hypothetical protein AB2665_02580 [Candidatus Thiodiazotropha sp.]